MKVDLLKSSQVKVNLESMVWKTIEQKSVGLRSLMGNDYEKVNPVENLLVSH